MKHLLFALVLALAPSAVALAENLVEIRNKSLMDRASYGLLYWCMEQDQIPAEYTVPGKFSIADVPMEPAEVGLIMVISGSKTVFLTTEECLDDAVVGYQEMGGSPEDLIIDKK